MIMTPVYYPMYRAIDSNKRVLVENKLKPVGYEACKAAYNECNDWLEQLKALIEKNR